MKASLTHHPDVTPTQDTERHDIDMGSSRLSLVDTPHSCPCPLSSRSRTIEQGSGAAPKKKKLGLGKLKSAVNKAMDVQALAGGAGGDDDDAGGSEAEIILKRQLKGLRITVANLTADKEKLAKDLEERTKSLNHYKGKKEAAAGGAKAEVEKVKVDFENYKRKSEDQLSKAKHYVGTLKKSLADAELNLDKLKKERAAVMAANRDAHATAEEAMARQAEIEKLQTDAAVAEPLRKFAKEICVALGLKYVDPGGDEDNGGESGGSGFLPQISGSSGSGAGAGRGVGNNPFKKAVNEAEGITAALERIQKAVDDGTPLIKTVPGGGGARGGGVPVGGARGAMAMRNAANKLKAAAGGGAGKSGDAEQLQKIEALEAELATTRSQLETSEEAKESATAEMRASVARAQSAEAEVEKLTAAAAAAAQKVDEPPKHQPSQSNAEGGFGLGKQVRQLERQLAQQTELRERAERALKDARGAGAGGGGGGTNNDNDGNGAIADSENTPLWVAGRSKVIDRNKIKEAWAASQKLHTYMKGLPNGPNVPEQPMASARRFKINLIINGVRGPRFDLETGDKGLFTAAMHYFALDRRPAAAVDFNRVPPPGSASSNLVCELVLAMPPKDKPYEATDKDVLGVSISLVDENGSPTEELVYAPSVIEMGEVMLAAEQSTAHNMKHFSIWPDLTSSWRWQSNARGGWELSRLRWRFLLKKVFPEIESPLQLVCL